MSDPWPSPLTNPLSSGDKTISAVLEFCRRHRKWAAQFTGSETVYSIPLLAIDCLEKPIYRGVHPLLDAATAEVERAFTSLCKKHLMVGMHAGFPIAFPLLTEAVAPSQSSFEGLPWSPSAAQLAAIRDMTNLLDETRNRLRGVIGWLLTEKSFLEEVEKVTKQYALIPKPHQPLFPLGRTYTSPQPAGFLEALVHLLDRWGLTCLRSWDLPEPQGPAFPDSLPPDSVPEPKHGVYVYIPAHYPLQGDDALQKRIAQFQRDEVTKQGIDPSFAGISHHETYERMFRVIHLECSIRSRFSHEPRGIVTGIENAAATVLGLSVARVQFLRRVIAQCRRGNRGKVR